MTAQAPSLRDLGITAGAVGAVAVLTPVWFVHDRATRLASSRRDGTVEPIDRIEAADIDISAVLARRAPVIVEGLTEHLGIPHVATPEHLVEVAGDLELDVSYRDARTPFFLYSGGYGAETVGHDHMSLAELVDLMFHRGVADGQVVYRLFGNTDLDGRISTILGEFDRALVEHGATATEPRFSGVWMGSRGATTPLHHDAWPGLLFQTHGRKRIAMYAPSDRTNLYLCNPLRGQGRWFEVPGRSADADPDEFPRVARARRFEAELRPGEALYIPAFWAHEIEALEANVSVPFRFATPRRGYLDPGFLRPASEVLRRRLGQLRGASASSPPLR